MTQSPNHNSQSGFLLPIVAILIATISIFLINGFAVFRLDTTPDRVAETMRRQDKLQNFLAAYAHRNYRIPCPADPDGAGTATRADDGFERAVNAGVGCLGGQVGILPWKTLGIPQDMAKDAWGHYFTYVVSPVFTLVNRNIFTNGADTLPKAAYTGLDFVHGRCRVENVWVFDRDTGPGFNYRNIHPFKARFCCPPFFGLPQPPMNVGAVRTDDVQILGYGGGGAEVDQSMMQTTTPASRTIDSSLYANFDTPVATYTTTESPTGMIYAILSHGRNGNGAFMGPLEGGTAKYALSLPSAAEAENSDDDNVLQWSPYVNSGDYTNTYFDDIMVFGTQDTLWNRLGGFDQSCARPYTDYAPMEWELGG